MDKNSFLNQIAPEKVFLVLALIFGLLFVAITPPFQNPDEPNHLYRAYQISDFKILGVRIDNSAGGYIPKQIVEMNNEITSKNITKWLKTKSDLTSPIFVDFRNIVIYPPVAYIPQTTGIIAARILKLSPLWIIYLGRALNLAAFITIVYFAIKIIPIYKWGLILLALMPMTITQASSLSADSMAFALSFFLIAYILNLALTKEEIKTRQILYIAGISFLMGLCKLAYVFIPFLFVLIPADKFSSKKKYFNSYFFVILSTFIGIFGWSLLIKHLYVPMFDYVNPQLQLQTIFSHPQYFIKGFLNSFVGFPFLHSFVGNLGWFDNPLPRWFVEIYLAVLLMCAIFENDTKISVDFVQKATTSAIIFLSFLAIEFIIYLHWNKLGATKIVDLQGRYFIPFAPMFFIPFYNHKTSLNASDKYAKSFLILFLIFSLILTAWFIFKKYW